MTDINHICAICKEPQTQPTTLNSCAHTYCLNCIQEWSKRENTCPLCKKRFHTLIEGENRHQITHKTQGSQQQPNAMFRYIARRLAERDMERFIARTGFPDCHDDVEYLNYCLTLQLERETEYLRQIESGSLLQIYIVH